MTSRLKLFKNLVADFKKDKSIDGVLLSGSVACGTATEYSDLDIIVLGKENKFVSSVIDGITVEVHYITFSKAIAKLNANPMEVYRYLDAVIEYDNGRLQEIIDCANEIYNSFNIDEKEKKEIFYWLGSTKSKLNSALLNNDELLISYLVSINTWKVLEGMWAVNHKPVPPASSLYRRYNDLKNVPFDGWFERLMTGSTESRAKAMIETIEWILTN